MLPYHILCGIFNKHSPWSSKKNKLKEETLPASESILKNYFVHDLVQTIAKRIIISTEFEKWGKNIATTGLWIFTTV